MEVRKVQLEYWFAPSDDNLTPQKYQYSPNGNDISGTFVKDLFPFSHPKRKIDPLRIVESKDFPIFAPAKTGEIVAARESAFFALFLDDESGQFA